MKHYIVMLVLACVSMSSYAVNPIKEGNMIAGHVIVKGTEESIPFATVMILGTNRGAVSTRKDNLNSVNWLPVNIRSVYR